MALFALDLRSFADAGGIRKAPDGHRVKQSGAPVDEIVKDSDFVAKSGAT